MSEFPASQDQSDTRRGAWVRQAKWGIIVTVFWLAGILLYSWNVWPNLIQLRPDEAATYFAGIFAPLAFLWLVLGFFQQGEELRNSAHALYLQGEELQNSVEQQRQLVAVQREQIDAERQALAAEKEENRRRSQPRLQIRSTGSTSFSGTQRYDYIIVNTGPECSDLELRRDGEIQFNVDRMGAHDKPQFGIMHDGRQPFNEAMIDVFYTDLSGARMLQQFVIRSAGTTPGRSEVLSTARGA